jgi:hypothetical protein
MSAATLATITALNMVNRGENPFSVFYIIVNALHQAIHIGGSNIFGCLSYPCLILL